MTVTLATLTRRTGLTVLDHLEQSVRIPVVDGLQAQGDLIVIPLAMLAGSVGAGRDTVWQPVPSAGVELLRGEAGGNPHTLVADPGTCLWTTQVADPDHLAIAMFEARDTVYLLHPEHGGTGCAPGTYVVRRQREREGPRMRLVAD
ncbi:hypothetical protein E1295_15610 [Nonomuraea mesophila]|uniref:Uncharacterized protein n=1 Tax=Nonomuraea mesophila TaxID=2530382 RepID=A0A4R5FMW6_9ACTN|nr:hypothetical protein [Nonomuraea mesophila]TDE54067.1 hypothetical protein E1295_15610 [Nonomuraea mesophila]